MIGLGTLINALAILLGGILGLMARDSFLVKHQWSIKGLLAALTVYAGATMIWKGLDGTFGQMAGQFGIGMLALMLGNVMGKLLRLQHSMTRLGSWAQARLKAGEDQKNWSEGFVTATLLFCVGPMALLGSIEDGLHREFRLLAIKGAMDGLATMGLVSVFGRGVILSLVPVVAYQGTITLAANALGAELSVPLANAIGVTGGLIVLMIPVVILEVRKAPLADYLPALVVAPLLTRWWM